MVNGIQKSQNLGFAYLPQTISKFHDLSIRAYRLELTRTGLINQVSGINT